LLHHQDEPFGTTTVYAQWSVMKLASHEVKVVLDGQGGDELLGGYLGYPAFAISQGNLSLFKKRLKLYGPKAFKDFYLALGIRWAPQKWKKIYYTFTQKKYLKYLKTVFPYLSPYEPNMEEVLSLVVSPNFNKRLWLDMTKYTIPQLLHYEDRNGMAFSIESRVPFLDYRLVDYVMGLPGVYKFNDGWSKFIFRIAMKEILPHQILWRKDKLGFSTPERKWLSSTNSHPFHAFIKKYKIPYDGNYFWWRLFITEYWLKSQRMD